MSRAQRSAHLSSSSGADRTGSWTIHAGRPHAGLRGLVARQIRWRAIHAGSAVTRELPSGEVQLILTTAPVDVRDPADPWRPGRPLRALVAGLHEGHAVTANPADSVGVQFGLTAPGAAELLGVSPRDLRDEVVDLRDLVGRAADELLERVHDAEDPRRQLAVVGSFLLERRPRRPRVAPEIRAAWARLEQAGGRVTVDQLAAMTGWSRRHLTARFHAQLGLPPKRFARLVRFRTAAALIEDPNGDELAVIAAQCGYTDQAHLSNEVRRFAGCTPAQLRAGRGLGTVGA
jgi:AraC-like DNA-binding protein